MALKIEGLSPIDRQGPRRWLFFSPNCAKDDIYFYRCHLLLALGSVKRGGEGNQTTHESIVPGVAGAVGGGVGNERRAPLPQRLIKLNKRRELPSQNASQRQRHTVMMFTGPLWGTPDGGIRNTAPKHCLFSSRSTS